ncbi:hypothetical protein [Paracidovorax avenae]|uniref:hypothetical protein n=1 Tax=Paracidovorax avenae TaxID=80867 RepID=UPI001F1DA5A9|nr:hypothetical protein [Paracidovorax avenae]
MHSTSMAPPDELPAANQTSGVLRNLGKSDDRFSKKQQLKIAKISFSVAKMHQEVQFVCS